MMFVFAIFGIVCLSLLVINHLSTPRQQNSLPPHLTAGMPPEDAARFNETMANAGAMIDNDGIRRLGVDRAVEQLYTAECYVRARHGRDVSNEFARGALDTLRDAYATNHDPRFIEAIARYESIPRG